jgi:hypothetical protein
LIFVFKTFRREGFFGVTNKYTSPQSIEFVLSNAIATREELRRSEAKSPQTVEIVLGMGGSRLCSYRARSDFVLRPLHRAQGGT